MRPWGDDTCAEAARGDHLTAVISGPHIFRVSEQYLKLLADFTETQDPPSPRDEG